jgi:uncharacterized protein (TIGR03663 family)
MDGTHMESTSQNESPVNSWLDRPLFKGNLRITPEVILISLVLLITILSRLIGLGWRVMSHDEVNHVIPSYDLYNGQGYSFSPVTHGPMQFHLLAASYFLFGDSDFTSRIPAALFSIATVAFVLFAWRRYLGKTGALLAGLFFMISPYMLFYGRYTRNEAFVGLFGVVMLYAVLHYLEKGKHSTLYLYTVVLALHFCTKETSFIYAAEILIFLGLVFLTDVIRKNWRSTSGRNIFVVAMLATLVFLVVALGISVITAKVPAADAAETANQLHPALYISLGLALASLAGGLVLLLTDLGLGELRKMRSFDLLILTFSVILPQLIAFPIKLLGWDPLDYTQPGILHTSIVLAVSVVLAVGLGMLWKPKLWAINAGIFYAIFTVFYTTFFTNGEGFFAGMVGALGYWLSQQAVNRGTQPSYYYALIQIPMYEYLAAAGVVLAFILGLRHRLFSTFAGIAPADQPAHQAQAALPAPAEEAAEDLPIAAEEVVESEEKRLPVLTLLIYWSVISLLAFSVAGEKMPWLTVHITLPMLLTAGFSVGFLVDRVRAKTITLRTVLGFVLLPILLVALGKAIGLLGGEPRPFSGHELANLQSTSTFIFAVLAAILSGWGIWKLLANWATVDLLRLLVIAFFGVLTVTTARSAFQASFVNYDSGKEFLVYAHAARGPKDVLAEVEKIATFTGEGKNIKVAYIADALYPYWWYFRDYPNKLYEETNLTRSLLNYSVVIVGDSQFTQAQAILQDEYTEFQYKRLVWPMQDYYNLKFSQVWNALKDPQMREALYKIWAYKDYSLYSQIKTRNDLTDATWEPSSTIRVYIRKDIISKIWTYGSLPSSTASSQTDPYADKYESLTPVSIVGSIGSESGQFNAVRDIALAADGSIYAADSRNNRIQHFTADGQFLAAWGSYASVDAGNAPGGTFNEPWGIAVGPDGSVYVADTWNHRIQKFNADGKFITMWGVSGPGDTGDSFWGPRGIVVDSKGHVLVSDTGNSRVVVFDKDGNYITQFGGKGVEQGAFDEPVGLAVDSADWVYVADTWNQRIQVFAPDATGAYYQYVKEWKVYGWNSQSTENKPFLEIDKNGLLYVTSPDKFRVLSFDLNGNFIRGWGAYSSGIDGFGRPVGIAVAADGAVWVADSENNRLLKFYVPASLGSGTILPDGLPALPESSLQLTYNFSTGLVENALGENVYRISQDGQTWQPVIPQSILDLLPQNTQPTFEGGQWVIRDLTGNQVFRWESNVLLWISTTEILPTVP